MHWDYKNEWLGFLIQYINLDTILAHILHLSLAITILAWLGCACRVLLILSLFSLSVATRVSKSAI